jgi:hypothetical protein
MNTEKKNKIQNTVCIIFIALFLLMLISPYLDEQLKIYDAGNGIEKRELARHIPFSFTTSFTKSFDDFYKDNFGFRMLLIDWGGLYKTRIFHASPKPEKALFGKNGWLFYNDTSDAIVRSYSHKNLLSKDQLTFRVKLWETIKDTCDHSGIKYIKVFWPDKQTIYPELLPFSMKIQIKDTLSKVDQIIAYLKETSSPVPFIDVRQPLLKGKKDHQLYYKFDSHWNNYGAFLAYRSFFQQAYKILGIEPKRINDFNITWKDTLGCDNDLVKMLGLSTNEGFNDLIPDFIYKNENENYHDLPTDGYPDKTWRITRCDKCGNDHKVLMFIDSYTIALAQFFSLSFDEVIYIWNGYDPDLVKQIKPDIVIDATVERYL